MMLSDGDWIALGLTFKLAFVSTAVLILWCLPVAWWLAKTRWRGRFILEAIIAMPLVLPPTVLGFYLLILLSPEGMIGRLLSSLGLGNMAFSFSGLVIGSCIYSLPFVMQPLQNAFSSLDHRQLEVAATLGASPLQRLITLILPMIKPGLITAAVLGFAHTLGEFGVVLMIGGNIPGETQVVSIAIYDHVESLQYQQAHWLAATLLLISFVLLLLVYATNKQFRLGAK
ncbi:molybdate ABC transporter permease subunit [Aliiglaciecola sp. LCG003]|uniref:molybdate ABC transporter permease subunit n=1 Tax=Aliiglaciecola sp. LCG003 TaxID=3053655 RepID=UPI002573608D|nr:molybdate ABC transporter permease subunit [Aliiglaciecola sp. LCG003]WJG10910.1 molybdate ABC transporter permease subunit [Aliiglaciecola sp. LCG003]